MQRQRERALPRRQFLRTQAGLVGTVALIGGGTTTVLAQDSENESGSETASNSGTESESPYTEIYDESIDDVVLVVVGGTGDGTETENQQGGLGSGFVVDDHVITNAHVVGEASDVELQFRDEQWRTGSVVGADPHSDIAVIEVDDFPDIVNGLSFADDDPVIGQEVLALGNPLGFDASASQGIVSGIDRSLPSPTGFAIPAAIQTDAPVNPGNSGGPLVTLDGDVLGIVFAGASQTIGFAISALLAERVVPQLIDTGTYEHAYMGVGVLPVGPQIAEANDLDEPRGVLVAETVPDSPADGVLEPVSGETTVDGTAVPAGGDVIVAIEGEPIPNEDRLSTVLALDTSPGDTIEIEIIRDGDHQTVELTLEERPEQEARTQTPPEPP
ncbi:S1C family serine protease [Natrialba asiatica]|uniref:Peptidase S1 and S6 chymotrypsin/Hap n=1 Tax=Natrialba asiatica (strain ATCC 700177 / DSM 12278 / JCM 9576 / FERM P-10747 / NBRC 102637 / 172P1) TaxID=29540 RepID=M0AVG5_NATA1|nr:trypsin-like peptidase domain-containing protein [Natrialba asiatica]ELZ01943.1 peptidase S1 and S6 chymotrypsin/Hap [Natrialba asiatica DSM 12278]